MLPVLRATTSLKLLQVAEALKLKTRVLLLPGAEAENKLAEADAVRCCRRKTAVQTLKLRLS
jgi:hypothetical protein